MNIQIVGGVLLSCLSFSILAKAPNPLCAGVTGANFTSGNGTVASPYLVCNQAQLAQIGSNATYLSQNFILGADLDFHGLSFAMIGSASNPFQGTFSGNGYTLSSINLPMGGSYVSIFPHTRNATVQNLLINGVTISGFVGSPIGGLVGLAESSTITGIRIQNLNMNAPDHSGGLVGDSENSTISKSSVQGVMNQNFGTDSSGGIIGIAMNSQVSTCASHVKLLQVNNTAYGVSAIGGLIGTAVQSNITNCYADSTIDYSSVTDFNAFQLAHGFGGLLGSGLNNAVVNGFYSGKMILPHAERVGGAGGGDVGSTTATNVFWDIVVSGVAQSSFGLAETTCLMKQKSFWLAQGFDPTIWLLVDGAYPKLNSES